MTTADTLAMAQQAKASPNARRPAGDNADIFVPLNDTDPRSISCFSGANAINAGKFVRRNTEELCIDR